MKVVNCIYQLADIADRNGFRPRMEKLIPDDYTFQNTQQNKKISPRPSDNDQNKSNDNNNNSNNTNNSNSSNNITSPKSNSRKVAISGNWLFFISDCMSWERVIIVASIVFLPISSVYYIRFLLSYQIKQAKIPTQRRNKRKQRQKQLKNKHD